MQIFSSRVNSSVVRFDLHSMLTIDMYLEIATHLYECTTLVSKILTMLRAKIIKFWAIDVFGREYQNI